VTNNGVAFLMSAAAGTRVVARYRIPGGFTDALGYLLGCDERDCVLDTRRGEVRVPLSAVVAAKRIPEPPARRRSSVSDDLHSDDRHTDDRHTDDRYSEGPRQQG
jgi:hypothetical protein